MRSEFQTEPVPLLSEPAKAPGRRERRRRETREKIYRAAMRLFSERGFFETTTEQITEAADVGQGTFFNYFPSKQHVLSVLSEIQLTKIRAAREQALRGERSLHDVLHALVHDIAQEPGQSQALTRALFSAIFSNEAVRSTAAELLAQGREVLAVVIAAGQERGEIRPDGKAADLALAFQRAVAGTLFLWAMQSKIGLKTWLEKAFRDFWAGAATTKGRIR
jgi:AcrR family transcriptional regulator